MNDPIVATMRQQRKQTEKIRRAKSKHEHLRKRNLQKLMPNYRLDHVVRERYPTFGDVLRDLDDALCLVFLFAHHPAYKQLSPDVVDHCQRLALEWQAFVVRTGALQKTFVSIKGVYYQAVVHGNVITWLVPHQFTHDVAADVDYRVMFTFLELNRTVLSFALYKLYTDTGYIYPPKLSAELDELVDPLGEILAGSTVADDDIDPEIDALIDTVQRRIAQADDDDDDDDGDDDGDDGGDDDGDDENDHDDDDGGATVKRSVKQLSSLDVHSIVDRESTAVADEAGDDADDVVGPAEFAPLAQDVETQAETHRLTRDDATANLFRGKTFFLAREVSRAACEFALRALGARVSWPGGPLDESDPSITHQVVDRARDAGAAPPRLGRHYVQPQWIFDSINNGAQMPLAEYAPDAVLPPHLSPFVDDERVGYVPAYRQRLNALLERAHTHRAALEAAGKVAVAEALSLDQAAAELDATATGNVVSTADAVAQYDAQSDPDVLEARHQRELEAEARGESFAQHSAAAVEELREQLSQPAPVVSKKKQTKRKFERVADALGIQTEEEAMATMLTTNRKRRAINKVARRATRKSAHVGALQAKRSELERKK
jgi:pescadillo protein